MVIYHTYILKSLKTEKFYIGSCSDLNARLKQHNQGKTRSTKHGVPWSVVYTERLLTKHDAYRREHQIKSYKGGEAFKLLLTS